MKTTKNYIIEGIHIKKDAEIELKETMGVVTPDNHYNNFNIDSEILNDVKSEEDLRLESENLVDQLISENLIDSNDRPGCMQDIFDMVKMEYARYQRLPTFEMVREYLRTRGPSFAT